MNDYLQQKFFPELDPKSLKVQHQIGRGAFSLVFSAYTPDFQRRAIKRIRLTRNPTSILREIEFLRGCASPHIIQLQQVVFNDFSLQTSLVFNKFDGDDFKAQIGRYTPDDLRHYIFSLLSALAVTERTLTHRDVKPGNFLYSKTLKRGVLIDFGLSQSISETISFFTPLNLEPQTPQNAFFPNPTNAQKQKLPNLPQSGTHGYHAPETILPLPQSPKIDIFSAFCAVLQIVLGKNSIFRSQNFQNFDEILAIRSVFGANRIAKVGCGINLLGTAPCGISLEELIYFSHPEFLVGCDFELVRLVRKMGELSAKNRLSAQELLNEFFKKGVKSQIQNEFQYNFRKSAISQIEYHNVSQLRSEAMKQRMHDVIQLLGGDEAALEPYMVSFERLDYRAIAQSGRRAAEKLLPRHSKNWDKKSLFDWQLIRRKLEVPKVSRAFFSFGTENYEPQLQNLERYQRAQRMTAQRRRVHREVAGVKALFAEYSHVLRQCRKSAEGWRRAVLDSNCFNSYNNIYKNERKEIGVENQNESQFQNRYSKRLRILQILKYEKISSGFFDFSVAENRLNLQNQNQQTTTEIAQMLVKNAIQQRKNWPIIRYFNEKIAKNFQARDLTLLKTALMAQETLETAEIALQRQLEIAVSSPKSHPQKPISISSLQHIRHLPVSLPQFLLRFFTTPHLSQRLKQLQFSGSADVKNVILAASCVQSFLDAHTPRSLEIQKITMIPTISRTRHRSQSSSLNVPKSGQFNQLCEAEKAKIKRPHISAFLELGVERVVREVGERVGGAEVEFQAMCGQTMLVRRFETVLAELSGKNKFAGEMLGIMQDEGGADCYQFIQQKMRENAVRRAVFKGYVK
ncbi:Kinase, CDC7 [Spironucleus salmonicida]|uniref:non-specific serine/threonine protein kinase n=1 Tax=Spironucleus salmonicida TaxID=348837 RepID=V6LKI0_9EUKA|nr:Kinase, CDC7 [Spironucleus salmonicida]|eukprot:EST44226.1 Kinase, CDC7 [Spironucleus salmonicida]